MKKYEIIEHTADIGIDVYGRTIRELFHHSAEGMFEIKMGNTNSNTHGDFFHNFTLQGEDYENLLVAWLSELLYISETKQVILTRIEIKRLSCRKIMTEVTGLKLNQTSKKIEREIKAVTYHGLEIKKDALSGIWTVSIILDI